MLTKHSLNYGAIIRTKITCKKIPCYIHDLTCRWRIVESTKIFVSFLKHFGNLLLVRNTESRLIYSNKFLSISQSLNQQSKASASFFFGSFTKASLQSCNNFIKKLSFHITFSLLSVLQRKKKILAAIVLSILVIF